MHSLVFNLNFKNWNTNKIIFKNHIPHKEKALKIAKMKKRKCVTKIKEKNTCYKNIHIFSEKELNRYFYLTTMSNQIYIKVM
jgi:hypothetical protein